MHTGILLSYFGLLALSLAYENLALKKPTYQQHSYYGSYYEASNAVDGLKSNLTYSGGQCMLSGGGETATWWVNLTSILSIHHITIYYMTHNAPWGTDSFLLGTFLGFSLYISNTTDKSQGTLCFKDSNYNASTIPPVVNITCPVHGQYVIYYNERLTNVTYPPDYYSYPAYNILCEVEVYGCPIPGFYGSNCSTPCPDPNCHLCHIETGTCNGCKPGYQGHQCKQECDYGFYGPNCIYNCVSTCDGCNNIDGGCDYGCKPGWKGVDCSETCLDGTYGHNCNNTCGNCLNVNDCFHTNGTCLTGCDPGYTGDVCETHCDNGTYGSECNNTCGHCINEDVCIHTNGTCLNGCDSGFVGALCKTRCDEGYYGTGCSQACGFCKNAVDCHHVNGTCLTGCESGYIGDMCKTPCENGTYGSDCNNTCGQCINNEVCIHTNGTCLNGCDPGYVGALCGTQCDEGFYGTECGQVCGRCKNAVDCHHVNGTCLTGCESGYIGDMCKTSCENGTYGYDCNNTCGHCTDKESCFHTNGTCLFGCNPGYMGELCKTACSQGTFGKECNATCGNCQGECDHISGICLTGCAPGYIGPLCKTPCSSGKYGEDCNNTCGICSEQDDCSHVNGTCFSGCDLGYTGALCKTQCSDGTYGKECEDTCGYCAGPDVCNHTNGSCPNGCEAGYQGILCKAHCMNGTYGHNCSNTCGHCLNGGYCFHVNGTCPLGCDSGYTGDLCNLHCDAGTFGKDCNSTCGHCVDEEPCFHINGTCLDGCVPGFNGEQCKTPCAEGFYGNACSHVCGHCVDHEGCHQINGSCLRGCTPGYIGYKCDIPCDDGTYGQDCNGICGNCLEGNSCSHTNGTCLNGCDTGYFGDLCKTACVQGTYGKECSSKCGNCLNTDGCDHINGSCLTGCVPGYVGDLCKTSCENGYYGVECNSTCGHCSFQNDCFHENGTCFNGCELGYSGDLCQNACSNGTYGKECNHTCGYCLDQDECHHINGTCVKGCDPGYLGDLCKKACNSGAYGIECNSTCGYCLDGTKCSHIDGICLNGCDPGFIGAMCRKRVLEILSFKATSLVVREGTPFEMRLSFLNMSECEFQWFHGDYEVTNTSTRYAMTMSKTDNGTSILTLHIGKSLKRDEGHWKIRVSSHGTFLARNLSIIVIPRLVLVMEPMFDFSIEEGEQLTIECTIQNPESLANIENGSLALTKGGSNLTPYSIAFYNTHLSVTWRKGTSVVDDSGVYTCLYTTYPDPVSVSVSATIIAQEQKRCNSEISNDIQWNTTLAGTTKREPCPPNQKGIATRQCNVEGIWEPPNVINCTTEAFLNASSELDTILEDGITDPEKTSKTIDNTLHLMNNLTSSTPELSAGDISSSIDILEKIVNVTNSSGSSIAKEVFFSVVDNVLSSNNSESWNAVSEKTEKDASSLLKSIDRLSEVVIQNDNISATQFTGSNFELTINKTKIDETGIRFPEVTSKNSTEVSDTVSTFFELGKQKRKTDKAMGYVAVIYKNIADILPASSERPDDTEKPSQRKAFVNSRVLSLTTQANIGSLNPPLKLTFQNVQTTSPSGMQPLCVSWNFSTKKWSEQGCILVKRDIKGTICECDHLTNFAILMRPYSSDTEDEQSLKTISLVGVILSIIFIALTFIIYILTWRFIKSDQNIMMLNLCVSLLLAYVVFISSVEQKDNEGLCVAITAVLHYLFLATFFNMLGMGLYYFMSITVTYYAMYVANNFKSESRIHWILVGTWGIPFVIVMIGLGSFWGEGYHLRFYCWLSSESGSLYLFIVPVCLIAVINILIIVSLVRVLCATSAMANSSLKKKAASGLRSLGTLLPVLGVTWLFGILAVNEKADTFQYIFVIANALQGVFIFASHVLLNKKIMLGLRKKYPVLNTLVSFVESSKEESSSVSKTNSSTEPQSALLNSKKRTFFVRYFGKNTKRNKVQKSESFLTEKTLSTDCSISDATGNSVEILENVPDSNKLQLIVEEDSPKRRFKFSLNINPWKKKYTVTGM
ncbi:uncharacterized protein LOC144623098 [Crassostrea virginica]